MKYNIKNKIKVNGEKRIFDKKRFFDKKVCLYGIGNLADNIYKRFKEQKIRVDYVVVDSKEYIHDFHGIPCFVFSDFVKKYECNNIILIISFASGYRKKEYLKKNYNFFSVCVIANPFEHHKHFGFSFIDSNLEKLNIVYNLFEDNMSRDVFTSFINSRIYENEEYMLSYAVKDIDEFENDVIHINSDEVFLDIGAYTGGSIKRFISSCRDKTISKIIGIEPEDRNFCLLKKNMDNIHDVPVELKKKGCWNKETFLAFNNKDDKCCRVEENSEYMIEVDTIDHLCSEDNITFINIGISTGVLEILEGAKNTIKTNKPKVVVFMGAAKEELYSIPLFFEKNYPEYSLYLRFQSSMPSRMFLYAIPDSGCKR